MPKSPTPALLLLLTRPHGKNVHRSNSPAICHASQPALAHINVRTHQKSENGYFTTTLCIVTLPKCLLCESTDLIEMDFIASASARCWIPPISLYALLKWKRMLLCLLLWSSSPPPQHHHQLLTQCLTKPVPSFGIWNPHSQMSKQRSLEVVHDGLRRCRSNGGPQTPSQWARE